MTLEDSQHYIQLIHSKGVQLFGSNYNKVNSENRIHNWLLQDRNKTIEGIYKTIHWWFDICGNSIEKANNGFGIVPYVYNEAMEYYDGIERMHKDLYTKEQIRDIFNRQEETVKVRIPSFKPKNYLKGFELS